MKVLVTGANGHIGANVVRAAITAGYQVTGMVREGADMRGLEGIDIELVYGDIRDAEAVEQAVQGHDDIIHLATPFSLDKKHPDEIIKPAMEGTRNVFQAAAKNNIQRIVYASSLAAVGPASKPGELNTEMDWNEDTTLPYNVAKTESEKLAWELAGELDLSLVVLCPPLVLGRYDYRITPSTEIVRDLFENIFPVMTAGGNSFVDVRDVASAFVEALTQGDAGERYLVSGKPVNYKEVCHTAKEITGRGPIYLPLPRNLSLAMIRLQEAVEQRLGKRVTLDHETATTWVGLYGYYDDSKAREHLNFAPRPFKNILIETIQWLLSINAFTPQTQAYLSARYEPGEY